MTWTRSEGTRMSPQQQLTGDDMRMAGGRSTVHGVVEIDVTDAIERVRTIESETGTDISFTAFVVHCLADTIADRSHVQRYRDWRGRLHEFDAVDVKVLVERDTDVEPLGTPRSSATQSDGPFARSTTRSGRSRRCL